MNVWCFHIQEMSMNDFMRMMNHRTSNHSSIHLSTAPHQQHITSHSHHTAAMPAEYQMN